MNGQPIGGVAEAVKPSMLQSVRWKISSCRYALVRNWRAGCDWLKWLGHKPGNLERHAEHELHVAGWFDKDGMYGDMMGHAVLKMVREFSEEGHSGLSANVAVNLFQEVAKFKPLTPLTGAKDEWKEIGNCLWQNKRCGHVFMELDPIDGWRHYDSRARVFREPSGACYTSRDSRVYVTFPYTPTTEYVDVPGDEA